MVPDASAVNHGESMPQNRMVDLRNQLTELRRRLTAAKEPFFDECQLTQNDAYNGDWTQLNTCMGTLYERLRHTRDQSERYAGQEALVALDECASAWLSELRYAYPTDVIATQSARSFMSILAEFEALLASIGDALMR